MAQQICPNCGQTFHAKPSKNKRHCSRACQKQAARPKRMRICAECGVRFEVDTSAKEGKFCSRACSAAAQSNRPPRPCAQCGNPFHVKPSSKRRFCSRTCYFESQRGQERPSMKGRPGWSKGLTVDTEPRLDARGRRMSGRNHPNWRGGRDKYYGPNWTRQNRRARERDNRTCRICGVTEAELGRSLDVHHIIPFKRFGFIYGKNDNYKRANDLGNLITVCPTCHRQAEQGEIATPTP